MTWNSGGGGGGGGGDPPICNAHMYVQFTSKHGLWWLHSMYLPNPCQSIVWCLTTRRRKFKSTCSFQVYQTVPLEDNWLELCEASNPTEERNRFLIQAWSFPFLTWWHSKNLRCDIMAYVSLTSPYNYRCFLKPGRCQMWSQSLNQLTTWVLLTTGQFLFCQCWANSWYRVKGFFKINEHCSNFFSSIHRLESIVSCFQCSDCWLSWLESPLRAG